MSETHDPTPIAPNDLTPSAEREAGGVSKNEDVVNADFEEVIADDETKGASHSAGPPESPAGEIPQYDYEDSAKREGVSKVFRIARTTVLVVVAMSVAGYLLVSRRDKAADDRELAIELAVDRLPPGVEAAWSAYVDRQLGRAILPRGDTVEVAATNDEVSPGVAFISRNSPFVVWCKTMDASVEFEHGYDPISVPIFGTSSLDPGVKPLVSVRKSFLSNLVDEVRQTFNSATDAIGLAGSTQPDFAMDSEEPPPLGVQPHSVAGEALSKSLCKRVATGMQAIMNSGPQ